MLDRTRIRKEKQKERRIKLLRAILIALTVIALWLILCGQVRKNRQVVSYEYISGSCLWDLARNCPDDMDKRDYITEIMTLNNMSSETVYANRLYQVPLYE